MQILICSLSVSFFLYTASNSNSRIDSYIFSCAADSFFCTFLNNFPKYCQIIFLVLFYTKQDIFQPYYALVVLSTNDWDFDMITTSISKVFNYCSFKLLLMYFYSSFALMISGQFNLVWLFVLLTIYIMLLEQWRSSENWIH